MDKGYEVLLVSQFTLYGRLKGNKADFTRAMPPNEVRTRCIKRPYACSILMADPLLLLAVLYCFQEWQGRKCDFGLLVKLGGIPNLRALRRWIPLFF
jgi:D-Tyr-tRNA(Tyr) deacylase